MKWQLVASVLCDVEAYTSTKAKKRHGLPHLRKAVFHIKLGPSSDGAPDHILHCSCPRSMVYDPAQVEWNQLGCWHMQKLY